MSFLRAIHLKKAGAVFLVVLFVFTHALKAFHTHEFYCPPVKNLANKNTAALKADFSCIICDFQIAADCDSEKLLVDISAPVYTTINKEYYNPGLVNSSPGIYSVRGPPAFII